MNDRITEMWAWTVVDPKSDTEGVPAFNGPDNTVYPMVGADRARIESLRSHARQVARELGVPVQLKRFTQMEVVATLMP